MDISQKEKHPANSLQELFAGCFFAPFRIALASGKGKQIMTLPGFLKKKKYFSNFYLKVWQFYNSHRISDERENHHPPLRTRKGVNM